MRLIALTFIILSPVFLDGCLRNPPVKSSEVTVPTELSATVPSTTVTSTDGFVPIFNGKDIDDWVTVLDSKWQVKDGVLFSNQKPDGRRNGETWLLTKKNYKDFILRLKYRIARGGNSGIFLRDPVPREARLKAEDGGTPPPWDASYEININNDEPVYPTGSIWATAKGPAKLQKEGEWNDIWVKLQGQRITVKINGVTSLDNVELPPRAESGAIGFQRHGEEQYREKLIEFRDVEIREL